MFILRGQAASQLMRQMNYQCQYLCLFFYLFIFLFTYLFNGCSVSFAIFFFQMYHYQINLRGCDETLAAFITIITVIMKANRKCVICCCLFCQLISYTKKTTLGNTQTGSAVAVCSSDSMFYCTIYEDFVTHLLVRVFLFELLQDLGHVSPGLLLIQILLIYIHTQRTIQEVNTMRVQHLPIHLNVHLQREKKAI